MTSYDVIIVGTRCAGAALAMLVARAGFKVLAVDRAAFTCGTLGGDAAYHRDPLTGMGIGDAFLGAELLAVAIADGLADGGARLGDALAAYQSNFRQRTMAEFDYTVRAAGLGDPASTLPLYTRIARSPEDTTPFMDVLGGTLALKAFFNPANLSRLMRS